MNKNQRTGITIAVILVVIIAGVYFLSKGSGSATGNVIALSGPVKIGFMAPSMDERGDNIKKAVDLAMKDSGLDNLEIVYEDTNCDENDAINGANKLIAVDGVVAIIGEVCPDATFAAASIAESNMVPIISPVSSATGDYVFSTVPNDADKASFAANLISSEKRNKLAILYEDNLAAVSFTGALWDEFESLGGTVVSSQKFESESSDIKEQLAAIKSSKPNAVFIVSSSSESGVIALTQAKESGINVRIYGNEQLMSPKILEMGIMAEGLTVVSLNTGTDEFVEAYENEYDEKPGIYAAQGYDALNALVIALKTDPSNSAELKNALNEVSFDGASGTVEFDNGNVPGSYEVYKVINGQFVLQAQPKKILSEEDTAESVESTPVIELP